MPSPKSRRSGANPSASNWQRLLRVLRSAGESRRRKVPRATTKRGLRVGYIATHYPAISHTFILREVRALRRLGLEVETFSIHRPKPAELLAEVDRDEARRTYTVLPARVLRLLGAHVLAFGRDPSAYLSTLAFALRRANPGVRGRLWGLFYFAEAIAIWRGARQRNVRHLHAIFADGASDVALLVRHYGGSGWSYSLAIHGPVEFYDVVRNRLAEKLASARFAVAISDFGRSQLMTLATEDRWPDIHVVRCGLELASFTPAQDDRSHAEPHILCVGRLVHLKGQSVLIRACRELRERGVRSRLTLVGDGPKRRELEELAERLELSDDVRFTGAVGQDRIRTIYATADIFCLPSFSEGLPVVLMEAMALSVPVVTTRVMGIPELVEDGVTGLLVSPGRVDELADALLTLAQDPARREELAIQALDKVRRDFDVNKSAHRLADLLAQALTERDSIGLR